MLIKLTAKGVNFFVDEDNTERIRDLRDNFGAQPQLTKTGRIKKYSEEAFREFIGGSTVKESAEQLFNLDTSIKLNNVGKGDEE